jgi:fumarate reductase flavoprotein subunit
MADGKAVGVEAEGAAGNSITVNAKAVILTTGGFGANFDKIAEYRPDLVDYCTTNADGIQGQGLDMAVEVGAKTVDLDQIQIHPTVHVDEGGNAHLITEGLRGDGAILVNQNGERFYDEVSTRDKVSAAEIAQQSETGADHVWLVMDQAMADASAVIQGYINNGYTVSGESYEELAEAMGVDAALFASTMEGWNACVEAGEDSQLSENQRTSFANPLNTAPYYAITVTPGIHHTMGGLVIDSKAEVIGSDDAAIPGLFAAGEVTGGVHGANRLGGNAVADITVFGRVAGTSAAEYVDAE